MKKLLLAAAMLGALPALPTLKLPSVVRSGPIPARPCRWKTWCRAATSRSTSSASSAAITSRSKRRTSATPTSRTAATSPTRSSSRPTLSGGGNPGVDTVGIAYDGSFLRAYLLANGDGTLNFSIGIDVNDAGTAADAGSLRAAEPDAAHRAGAVLAASAGRSIDPVARTTGPDFPTTR